MIQKTIYDITEVCKMLGTTSRTLRFYEEKGIITSTTDGFSSRRRYTEEQVAQIRNVLVLRTLGLSLKSIAELQAQTSDLKEAVLFKRAEIYAAIDRRVREIHRLNEVLSALGDGKDIFCESQQILSAPNSEKAEIARQCAEAIRKGDTDAVYRFLGDRLIKKMPKDVYEKAREETLAPIGDFVSFDTVRETLPNTMECFLEFSKLGLKITCVFASEKNTIEGLWLGYYDRNRTEREIQ